MDNVNKVRNLVAEVRHHLAKVEEYLKKLDVQPKPDEAKIILDKYKWYELQGTVIKYNGDFKDIYRELKTNISQEIPM